MKSRIKLFFLLLLITIITIFLVNKYKRYKLKINNYYESGIVPYLKYDLFSFYKTYLYFPHTGKDFMNFIYGGSTSYEYVYQKFSLNIYVDSVDNQVIIYDNGYDNKNDSLRKRIYNNKIGFFKSLISKGDVLLFKEPIDTILFYSIDTYGFVNSHVGKIFTNDSVIYDTLMLRLKKYYKIHGYQKLDSNFDHFDLNSPKTKKVLISGVRKDDKFNIKIINQNLDSIELVTGFLNSYFSFLENHNFNDSITKFYIAIPIYEKSQIR